MTTSPRHVLGLVLVTLLAGCQSAPRSDSKYRLEVQRFMQDSAKEKDIFPWKRQSPAVDRIALLGQRVSPDLIAALEDIQHFYDGQDFDFTTQQNIVTALCKIHGLDPEFDQNVYGVRNTPAENLKVFAYWKHFRAPAL